ncbi:hypothetical protein O6H91_16G064000 [Diphasiastrum complanatum]|uniref:Uncharacterized protein n=1 Tax=Diphasiastrum complanatum TaxID=34168 RepID=A0ACC2BCW0_DIPCM|nr:hypothetical protein O6H91_16G064000 [Diphasiastrum complanatum]
MAEAGGVHFIQSQEAWEAKLKEASAEGKMIISNFTATWCRPCKSIAPHFHALSLKHPDIVFLKIDVDQMPDLADEFDVQAMPTFVFTRNGNRIDRLVGANLRDLERKVAGHAAS